jgi:AraC family transcriptional regulator
LPDRGPLIGLRFEKQLTRFAKLRRWELGNGVPRWPSSVHDAVELCWVERGRCRYSIGLRTIDVEQGGAILVPADVEHRTDVEPGTRAGSMWLSASLFDEVASAAKAKPPALGAIARADVVSTSRALLSAAESGLDAALADCAIEGLMLRILSADVRFNGTRDPRIARAVDEIESRYTEALDVEDLARAARMSRFHFSRVFRAAVGRSPYQYLLDVRVDRAAALLASGQVNVTEAALAVGFTDLGRFGRAFKARTGRAPSQIARNTKHSARIA